MASRFHLNNAALVALLLCLSLAIPGAVRAAEEPAEPPVTLQVGDAAPALTPGKWLKGEPVTGFEKGKTYVVEFWATWCGPCKASIPHLSEIQKKYPKVTIIGQDCLEENQSEVADFVKKMGEKMEYRVAIDDTTDDKKKEAANAPGKDVPGKMVHAWLMASGEGGIPTAFVVDGASKIAWIGHPMELEDVLKAIEAGTFDAKKVAAEKAAIKADQKKLVKLLQANKIDDALAHVDAMAKAHPHEAASLIGLKVNLLMQKKDYAAISAMGPTILETFKDQLEPLNAIAWSIVTPEVEVEKRDLDLAEKLASRAVEVSKGENGGALDTLARVFFLRNNIDKAIELQTKAVEKADDETREQVKKTLTEYKAAKEKAAK